MREIRQGIAQVDHLRPQRLFAGIGQQLTHQRRRAIGILIDLHEIAVIRITLIMA